MTRPRTYYDLFGVAPTATSGEIRCAYLALVKRHHPDSQEDRQRSSGSELLPLINRCYAVLKNPAKRAEYDAGLARERPRSEVALKPRPVDSGANRRWLIHPMLVAAIAAAAAAGVLLRLATIPASSPNAAQIQASGSSQSETQPAFPTDGEIAKQVRLAISLPVPQAVAMSKSCFNAALAQDDSERAQLCIVFDEAVLYWRKPPASNLNLPPYFSDPLVDFRQNDALAPFASQPTQRLNELRHRAFLALVREIPRPHAAASDPPSADTPEQLDIAGENTSSSQVSHIETDVARGND